MHSGRPKTWADCLQFARGRFQAYFVNKTKSLLHAFPLDHVADPKTGELFWVSPKRPPREIPFDFGDDTHRLFVLSCAALQAAVFGIAVPDGLRSPSEALLADCRQAIEATAVPEWQPRSKKIVTDEGASKEEAQKAEEAESSGPSEDELDALCKDVASTLEAAGSASAVGSVQFADFEKDDDSNFHIDFLAACANLRARMYAIKEVERLKVKGIAGRIMPAIATTTAAVSGCVSTELVKIVKGCEMEEHRNLFMNLALPFWGFAEPVAPEKKMLTDKVGVTLWDQWEIKTDKGGDMTLQEFVDAVKSQYDLDVGGVFKGAMMVYVPMFPGHKRRLGKKMKELLRHDGKLEYQDLTVTFSDGKEDVSGPPVRFYY
jgi:ubiquitin-activating enzyme E1-like protein 2